MTKLNDMFNQLKMYLDEQKYDEFRTEFLELHPFDREEIFFDFSIEERAIIYSILSSEEISEILEYLENEEDTTALLEEMNQDLASDVISKMSYDDAVDILQQMDYSQASNYLEIMDDETSSEIRQLLYYDEGIAGSIMTNEFIVFKKDMTVKQAMKQLIAEANDAETIYTLYVVDESDVLVGVLSLKELIVARGDLTIEEVMNDDPRSVNVSDDQEEVANIMRDYDFLAIPVVDSGNHLLGIITIDDVIDVLDEEATEDYSKFAAISDVEVDYDTETVFQSVKKRIPWLLILMVVGLFTASIISNYETTIAKVAILSTFLPLILGMAGNTGTQALAVTLRGLTTDELAGRKAIVSHLWRELRIGLVNGMIAGITVFFVVSVLMRENLLLGVVIAASIICALTVSTFAGAVIPLLISYVKLDPAVASGPFISTINDVIAVTIYLSLATLFLERLL